MTCNTCGLVQSVQKQDASSSKDISTSSDATWGNVRHGKRLRLQHSLKLIQDNLDILTWQKVLDVGASRGDFVLWLSKENPSANITATEPYQAMTEPYQHKENITVIADTFENISLPENSFDFIYCIHTLEHVDNASFFLQKLYTITRLTGYVFLEVPNLAVIETPDIVEEFFMDKHTSHFNRELLCDYVEYLGFTVISGKDDTDVSNISLLLQKTAQKPRTKAFVPKHKALTADNKMEISTYVKRLTKNRAKMQTIAGNLNELMKRQRVVFVGAGRIFDALVTYGKLPLQSIPYVVDQYLAGIVPTVHGVPVKSPDYLRLHEPQVVVILAKSSVAEIERTVRRYGIRNIIKIGDLLAASESS